LKTNHLATLARAQNICDYFFVGYTAAKTPLPTAADKKLDFLSRLRRMSFIYIVNGTFWHIWQIFDSWEIV
jgi:hypothetical protein